MFDTLPASVQAELSQLAERFGQPLIEAAHLGDSGSFAPLGKPDRFGEVCMVVRRADGSLITARKEYYPPHIFRLLTGGIGHGEPVHDALLRETAEETGLDVTVERFLAALSYRLADEPEPSFYTFAFLLQERGGTLGAVDPDERVAAFRMVPPAGLAALAEALEQLTGSDDHEIGGSWRDWGRFRALGHRLVAAA
ncbi:MAG TPA: NUDIX hydrolase, partial [Herpetosiphonaceae bacterium]